jgi:hypothetical protein
VSVQRSDTLGGSFEEEERLTEKEWKRRIHSVLFALSDDRPVGARACYDERRTDI